MFVTIVVRVVQKDHVYVTVLDEVVHVNPRLNNPTSCLHKR